MSISEKNVKKIKNTEGSSTSSEYFTANDTFDENNEDGDVLKSNKEMSDNKSQNSCDRRDSPSQDTKYKIYGYYSLSRDHESGHCIIVSKDGLNKRKMNGFADSKGNYGGSFNYPDKILLGDVSNWHLLIGNSTKYSERDIKSVKNKQRPFIKSKSIH